MGGSQGGNVVVDGTAGLTQAWDTAHACVPSTAELCSVRFSVLSSIHSYLTCSSGCLIHLPPVLPTPCCRSDGFVVQTGDPEGPDDSFRDPETGEIRK